MIEVYNKFSEFAAYLITEWFIILLFLLQVLRIHTSPVGHADLLKDFSHEDVFIMNSSSTMRG
jgi:hypothetical protein